MTIEADDLPTIEDSEFREAAFHYQWQIGEDQKGAALVVYTFVGGESGQGLRVAMDPLNAFKFLEDIRESVDSLREIMTQAQREGLDG